MKRLLSLSALALLAAAATPSAAVQSPQGSPNTSILFTRATFDPQTGQTLQSALFRINPTDGIIVPISPAATPGYRYLQGRWSPSGSSIVYAHYTPTTYPQLAIVNRQGGSVREITSGRDLHTQPVWGPHGNIAFITDRSYDGVPASDEGCLSVVKANGTEQHILFCPPFRSDLRTFFSTSTPQWSVDGKSIYIEVEALEAGLDPTFGDSRIYRVNVTTGAVAKITEQKFDGDTGTVSIAPDGKHAVYALTGVNAPLVLVDLMTGSRKTLAATGADVRYSKDGCRIAFVRRASIINTQMFGTVFVMNADGSHVHPAISHPDPSATYAIGDWSPDGSRLLVNKAVNNEVNDQVLQIVNLATGKASTLTQGTAGEGAWHRP